MPKVFAYSGVMVLTLVPVSRSTMVLWPSRVTQPRFSYPIHQGSTLGLSLGASFSALTDFTVALIDLHFPLVFLFVLGSKLPCGIPFSCLKTSCGPYIWDSLSSSGRDCHTHDSIYGDPQNIAGP